MIPRLFLDDHKRLIDIRKETIEVSVDNTLVGSLDADERIEVWRWIDQSPSYLVHVFLNRTWVDPLRDLLYQDKRYLFLIARENDKFRMFVDFRRSWIHIPSGVHRELPGGVGETQLESLVAGMLLSPGSSDYDAAEFSSGLSLSFVEAVSLVGVDEATSLASELLNAEEQEVREAACLTIAKFGKRDETPQCLAGILSDPSVSERTRRLAEQIVNDPVLKWLKFPVGVR